MAISETQSSAEAMALTIEAHRSALLRQFVPADQAFELTKLYAQNVYQLQQRIVMAQTVVNIAKQTGNPDDVTKAIQALAVAVMQASGTR